MDSPPTISGMNAATTDPKTMSRSSPTRGRAAFSAREMSLAMPSSSASATAVAPAIWTGTSADFRSSSTARKSLSVCSPSPFSPMAANAVEWSLFTMFGFRVSK